MCASSTSSLWTLLRAHQHTMPVLTEHISHLVGLVWSSLGSDTNQKPLSSGWVDGEGTQGMTWDGDGETELLLVHSRVWVSIGHSAPCSAPWCPGPGHLARQDVLLHRVIFLQCGQAGSGPFVPPVLVPRARAQHSTNPRLVSGTDCSASP